MIIPDGFGQVNFLFAGTGLPTGAQVALGFAHSGTTQAITVASQFYNNFEATVLPRLANTVALTGTLVKFGPNDTGASAEYAELQLGGQAGAQAPPNVAYLVHKVTDFGGRRGRGRMFIPGVVEGDVNQNGTVDAPDLVLLQTALNTFMTTADTQGYPLALLHSPGEGIVQPYEITALTADSMVATQRRRLRR